MESSGVGIEGKEIVNNDAGQEIRIPTDPINSGSA